MNKRKKVKNLAQTSQAHMEQTKLSKQHLTRFPNNQLEQEDTADLQVNVMKT